MLLVDPNGRLQNIKVYVVLKSIQKPGTDLENKFFISIHLSQKSAKAMRENGPSNEHWEVEPRTALKFTPIEEANRSIPGVYRKSGDPTIYYSDGGIGVVRRIPQRQIKAQDKEVIKKNK